GSGQGSITNSNSGTAGTLQRANARASYRDQLSSTTQINGSYTYGKTHNFVISNSNGAQFNTITLPSGRDSSVTTIDTLSSVARNNSYSHNFTFDYEWQQKDTTNYIRIRPNYSYTDNASTTSSTGNYVGYQNQANINNQTNTTTSPTYNVVATYQHLWKKDRRQNISVQYTYTNTGSDILSTTNEHIIYRNALSV